MAAHLILIRFMGISNNYPRQPGLFDVEERAAQLTQMGDPLVELNTRIDWEAFRPDLSRVHEKDRKSKAEPSPSMSC